MKTRVRIVGALLLLLLPSLARYQMFYQGVYAPASAPQAPEYAEIDWALPDITTPEAFFAVDGAGKVVVLDAVHRNLFELDDVQVLLDLFNAAGAQVMVLDNAFMPLEMVLKYTDAYITIAPTSKFHAGEVALLERFVTRGGRLLVITDPTRNGMEAESLLDFELGPPDADVRAANSLLQPFGMAFAADYVYNILDNEGNYRNVKFSEFAASPITRGLAEVVFYAAHSVHALSGTPLLWGGDRVFSSRTDTSGQLAPVALSAEGNVLAVGDLTFLTAPYYQVSDNGLFIAHLAEFLLQGTRAYTLDNYPYLFQQPVTVLPLIPDFTLTADMLEKFVTLQATLNALGIVAQLGTEPLPDTDLLILATYDFGAEALPYLEPFGFEAVVVEADEDPMANDTLPLSDTLVLTPTYGIAWWDEPEPAPPPTPEPVFIPGVGNLSRTATGVLIYAHTEERATLILLADSTPALGRLMLTLRDGDLAACVTQPQMALCRIPAGDDAEEMNDEAFDGGLEEPTYPGLLAPPAPFPPDEEPEG